MDKNKSSLLPKIMMILLFGMIAFVTNLAAPMGIILKEQFQVSNFLGMLGNFANFIAYAIMGLPAGFLLSKLGYRKTALLAIAVGFSGVAIQLLSGILSSFAVYISGAFVAGFSMCMLNTVINPMLNILGGGGKKGNQLIQIGGTVSSIMATLVPILVGFLIGTVTQYTEIEDVNILMYIALGTFVVIGASLCFIDIREPERDSEEKSSGKSHWQYPHFLLGVLAIFVGTGVEGSIPATLNFYLVDYGLSTVSAGTVVGMYFLLMLFGRFAGVFMSGRLSSQSMLKMSAVSGIIILSLAVFLPETISVNAPVLSSADHRLGFVCQYLPINAVLLVCTGICTSVLWGVIFNLAVDGLGPLVSKASGIFMMMVCGGGVIPLLQNKVADEFGFLPSYSVLLVCFCYLLFYAIIGFKIRK